MRFRFPLPARLAPLLAALLYVFATAADPLLHAHVGEDAHAHPGGSLCPAEEAPEEGHDPAKCAVCRLSSSPGEALHPAPPRPASTREGRAPAPRTSARSPLAHLSPAPRGPPHG